MLAGFNISSLSGGKLLQTEKFLTWLNTFILSSLKTPTNNILSLQSVLILARLQLLMVKYNNCLQKGFLDEIDPSYGQYVSTILLRKKKNGSYRLILNRKGLNESVEYQHFKMESLTCAIQLMKKNCNMASIDLTDAYYTVPVAVEHRKYLRFFSRNRLFQYTCLPNGLASAPRYFTKLLKPVYSTLHSQGYLNVGYIDDSYYRGA